MHDSARQTAEVAARDSFGRLSSRLAWQWRDIAAAEDALADALLKALQEWPEKGIPDSPDAWLLVVAKRQLLQWARHDRVRYDPAITVLFDNDEAASAAPDIPDTRLKLLFVCAHPAIDKSIRTPLMLQTVLGLDAKDIAAAMLVSPTALAQRLVRAKQKIKDTGLRFEEPEARDLPERLHCVLEAIYAASGLERESVEGAEHKTRELQGEALFLCQLVCQLLPDSAEAMGLLALMVLRNSRQAAQWSADGRFVPLSQQDTALWDKAAIQRADQFLWEAAKLRQPGPFQLEAAIQSAHCHRLFFGFTPWKGIVALYDQLNTHYPTLGSQVAEAVALMHDGQAPLGLQKLDAMDAKSTRGFQPWWLTRAYLLAALDRNGEALGAIEVAIGLTESPKLKLHLLRVKADIG
jgi:RNA polymerase sigma-70 factor (ECF subfamily)